MYSFEAIKSESPYYQEVVFYYKANPCPSIQPQKNHRAKNFSANCNQHSCFNYHGFHERRRPAFDDKTKQLLYEPIWCPNLNENGTCSQEDSCQYAHTQNEINYHPLYYKTEVCKGCQYGLNPKLCPKFHSDETNRTLILEKFKNKEGKSSSSGHASEDNSMQKGFYLDRFKTKQCTIKGNHNPKVCDYYHFDKDRRRPSDVYTYSPDLCQYVEKGEICPNGDDCGYCHNKVEQLYHPERYKKKFCLCHPHNIHKCEYGNYCSFAHSEAEIEIELLHNIKKDASFYINKFKTVFCPYIYNHDRTQCVYAHNPQDFRRDPNKYNYRPVQCQNWSQGQILSYEKGNCPKGMDCENCHGWKELEYHPKVYKTKYCSNSKSCIKIDCPFLHPGRDNNDKPQPTQSRNLSMGMSRDFGTFSPIKQSGFGGEKEYKTSFYGNSGVKQKESNFRGPIMPHHEKNFHSSKDEFKENELKTKPYKKQGSTRPNSNVSSAFYSEEDAPKKKQKKKKKKQMSLQTKNEEESKEEELALDPMQGSKKGKGGKTASSPQINFWGVQSPVSAEKSEENFESKKPVLKLSGSKTNDSFESLQSYTIEKPVGFEKNIKINNEQFKKSLTNALQKKGLDYTIPFLLSPRADIESLKSFSQKDFNMFPLIKVEDKEKIMNMIKKLLEEENFGVIGGEITSNIGFEINGDENQWGGTLDFLDTNESLGFKHPFA